MGAPQCVRFGTFELDAVSGELRRDGRRVPLQTQPAQVLAQLVSHPGEVVSRDELRHALWSDDTFVEVDTALNVAVNKIRHALQDSAATPRFIETLPGRGYRFLADVHVVATAMAAPEIPALGPSAALSSPTPLETPAADPLSASPGRRWAFAGVALAVAVLVLVAWQLGSRLPAPPPQPHSVAVLPSAPQGAPGGAGPITSLAVLPLENLSGDPDQEYFADGMTDALITELAKIRALRVTSRTSIMSYKKTRKPLPQIARELGVDAFVEGALLRQGERVRITAQLVLGRTDQHLWAEGYERDVRDALGLQREIALAIAREVRVQVTPEEARRLGPARSIDPKANEAYLRGLYHFHEGLRSEPPDREKLRRSIPSYQEAIRLEPRLGQAWSALAKSYHHLASGGEVQLYPKAKAAAMEALQIDETLAQAHGALGFTIWRSEWDWAGAEREFRRALELNPGTYAWSYALLLSGSGRHAEAVEHMRLAERLDPMTLAIKVQMGLIYINARLYDRALEHSRHVLEIAPELHPQVRFNIGVALVLKGRCSEALAELREGDDDYTLAWAVAACGDRSEAERLLLRLEKKGDVPGYDIDLAWILAALGRHDDAFARLEQAYRLRDHFLLLLLEAPSFDPIRSDPRFGDLQRRVGIPPTKSS